jgi:hypothetical protein
VAGALLVPRLKPPFAFDTPPDPAAGLLKRQVGVRKSRWPEEYR